MARTIQSTGQMKGKQIPQLERKKAQSGSSLPSGKATKKRKGKKKMGNPSHA